MTIKHFIEKVCEAGLGNASSQKACKQREGIGELGATGVGAWRRRKNRRSWIRRGRKNCLPESQGRSSLDIVRFLWRIPREWQCLCAPKPSSRIFYTPEVKHQSSEHQVERCLGTKIFLRTCCPCQSPVAEDKA